MTINMDLTRRSGVGDSQWSSPISRYRSNPDSEDSPRMAPNIYVRTVERYAVMKLGVGPITCQRTTADERWSAIYANMVGYAKTVEEVGLDSMWVTEHHFVGDGYMSSPLTSLSAIAAVTEEINVGTSICLLPLHNPLRIAEHGATIDLISEGRLIFGVGLGYRTVEFDVFNSDFEERTGLLEDGVNVLRGAWSPGPLDYDSEYHDIPRDISVTPKPDAVPPITFAGHAKPAVRRAARLGEGWNGFPTDTPEEVATRADDIRTVREEEGISGDFTIFPGSRGFVAESKKEAWEAMKDGLFHMRSMYARFGLKQGMPEVAEADSIDELPEGTVQKMKDNAIFGPPEVVVEELEEYKDAAGDDAHFVFRTFIPGVQEEQMEECLRLLGEEVQPHL